MPPACCASPAIQGQKEVTGGVRQELPCSSGVRQTATLAHTPGSCHAACTHRFLCKPPHETPVRLIRTVCHELILPDVIRAIFHAEIKALKWIKCKLAYGQAMDHVDQPTKIGPVPLLFKWILVRHYWHGQRGCQLAAARTKQPSQKARPQAMASLMSCVVIGFTKRIARSADCLCEQRVWPLLSSRWTLDRSVAM